MDGEVEALRARLHLACRRAGTAVASATRPQPGTGRRACSTPFWKSSSSTRPSDAASSVCRPPDAARPFRPASSRHRSTALASSFARHASSTGVRDLEQLFRAACASAVAQPTIASRTSFESVASNSLRVSSVATIDDCRRAPLRRARELARRRAACARARALDVPLVARLRPAALVVLARLLLAMVDDSSSRPPRQPVELPAFPADDGHDRALAAADERHQRREIQLAARPSPRPAPARSAAGSRQRLSSPAANTARPRVPSRSKSSSMKRRIRSKSSLAAPPSDRASARCSSRAARSPSRSSALTPSWRRRRRSARCSGSRSRYRLTAQPRPAAERSPAPSACPN